MVTVKSRILIIDNYDSFTFNLKHYFEQLSDAVVVKRNDELTIEEVSDFTHLVISPGPGLPADAGITMELIDHFYKIKPILGVCLGCQALAQHTGAVLYNQQFVAHGIQRTVHCTDNQGWLLADMPEHFSVGLYHSWAIAEKSLSGEWKITAHSENGIVMAIEHRELPVAGVQFHPESVMSSSGLKILQNWLNHSQ